MDAETMPTINMPNRDAFIEDGRPDTAAKRCMEDCPPIGTVAERDHALAGERVDAEAKVAARFAILTIVPGISETTAIAILVNMPELGSLDQRQALYMPALVATRFTPDLKRKYRALIASGMPAKLAPTAIMRELLLLANALLREGVVRFTASSTEGGSATWEARNRRQLLSASAFEGSIRTWRRVQRSGAASAGKTAACGRGKNSRW